MAVADLEFISSAAPLPGKRLHGMASSSISLDDLIALNDEISALSRAGVPLHRGLRLLADEMPGRTGAAAKELGARLEAGESLEQALASLDTLRLPDAYLAVVRAGLRAGRLPVALEGIATAARRAAQLRRMVGLALIYPAVVTAMAFTLLVLAVMFWLPMITAFYDRLELEVPTVLEWLIDAGKWAPLWVPLLLAAIFTAWLLWFLRGRLTWGRSGAGSRRRPRGGVTGILRTGRLAGFAEVLALLVEQHVPLAEALRLAGDAVGDRTLAEGCRELAERLERGQPDPGHQLPRGVPPLLVWILVNGRHPEYLAASLRQFAASYRARAQESADWLAFYLPIGLTAGIGGTAVGLYGLVVFAPWTQVLLHLGRNI